MAGYKEDPKGESKVSSKGQFFEMDALDDEVGESQRIQPSAIVQRNNFGLIV